MTAKEFMKAVTHGESDLVQLLLDVLERTGAQYCVIGGLGVNAYVEPVVSLDLDLVVIAETIDTLCETLSGMGMKVERFAHRINLSSPQSDLRIQMKTDSRYQDFLSRAQLREVLGYKMRVAAMEDVLAGKVWDHADETRRESKRQKDLADIARLVEAYPELEKRLPDAVLKQIQ